MSSLSAANEANVDAVERDLVVLREQLHEFSVRVAVLDSLAKSSPKIDEGLTAVYSRIEEVAGQLRASIAATTTQIQEVSTQVALIKQRMEDHLPIRRDQTPLHVPTQTPTATTTPTSSHSDLTTLSRDIAQKWSPLVTALIALLMSLINQCNPPSVERTTDGRTRVVFPVAANAPARQDSVAPTNPTTEENH